MRLENFEIASSIELQFEGQVWDLHNSAYFRGFQLSAADNTAVMDWSSLNSPSLPGRRGIRLRFNGLESVQLTPRDGDLPLTEDTCVADIVKVDPAVQHADPYIRAVLDYSDRFRLAFRFQSGRIIEIGSESVAFIVFSDEDFAERYQQ
ncbi:MAG TPA: hypothetical protein VGF20_13805 [Candidatus Acidoferrum sp.]